MYRTNEFVEKLDNLIKSKPKKTDIKKFLKANKNIRYSLESIKKDEDNYIISLTDNAEILVIPFVNIDNVVNKITVKISLSDDNYTTAVEVTDINDILMGLAPEIYKNIFIDFLLYITYLDDQDNIDEEDREDEAFDENQEPEEE